MVLQGNFCPWDVAVRIYTIELWAIWYSVPYWPEHSGGGSWLIFSDSMSCLKALNRYCNRRTFPQKSHWHKFHRGKSLFIFFISEDAGIFKELNFLLQLVTASYFVHFICVTHLGMRNQRYCFFSKLSQLSSGAFNTYESFYYSYQLNEAINSPIYV